MSLRRKILFKDAALITGLVLIIACAMWGFHRQRLHVQASLNEYAALQKVELAEVNLIAFQHQVHAGEMRKPSSIADLRSAISAMSQYKAVISQYETVLPPEITADLQTAARLRTKSIIEGLVRIHSQINPSHTRATEPDEPMDDAAIAMSIDRLADQCADLMSTCNGFVHRTELESQRDLRESTVIVASLAGAILVIALAGSFWQYRKVIIPIRRLRDWCRQTARGEFSSRFEPTSDREFQELALDVNRMADELNAFYQRLEAMVASKSRELVRSERLASVGYLAAGVAHEINNPLNIMSGYAELSLKRLRRKTADAADDLTIEQLSIIRSEAFRCKEITHKLLSLAKGNGHARETVSLNDAVADVSTLVRGLKTFRGKQLKVEIDPEQPLLIRTNLTEIKQVLLNLIINAIEAVNEGSGIVTVSADKKSDWVELRVCDNGRGMSAETLERVFEPFFTNKRGAGEPGTGLGLSITHAIVTDHGGEIRASSDGPGFGSQFTIRFPAVVLPEEMTVDQSNVEVVSG